MLNLVQHLTKSISYETLKQVQGDKLGLFTRPSHFEKPKKTVMLNPDSASHLLVQFDEILKQVQDDKFFLVLTSDLRPLY